MRRVFTEACHRLGDLTPAAVIVTHPAHWDPARVALLRETIEKAGLSGALLVPEPVAAAIGVAMATPPGTHIAICDFGGGTSTTAVLRRTETSFVLEGLPSVHDALGGEEIDQRLIKYLGEGLGESDPEIWARLMEPPDLTWSRNALDLGIEC